MPKTLTRTDLTKLVAQLGTTKAKAALVVDTLICNIATTLLEGGTVEIREFGTLSVRQHALRHYRLPTNHTIKPAHKRVFFKNSKNLLKQLNPN